MKISDRLFERLKSIGLSPATQPRRHRTGYWQRTSGAWKWSCKSTCGREIGSQNTMRECLVATQENILFTHYGDIDIVI